MTLDRFAFPAELGISAIEAPLAALLVSRTRVSSLVAFEVLYGGRPAQNRPQFETLKVHISHLRRKFAKLDLSIETLWGWGWQMPAADRARLKALMRANVAGSGEQ